MTPSASEAALTAPRGATGDLRLVVCRVTVSESEKKSEMPQAKSENSTLFSEKSEILARELGIGLDALPARIGISKDMFYAYRTGRYPISGKAWRKLEAAEIAAGLGRADKPEPYGVINEAPAAVQEAFFAPGLAWPHYLAAEALLDHLLAERANKPLSEEDHRNFGETLRHFMAHRDRGRKALHEATKLAEDIGNRVLGQWMAAIDPARDAPTPPDLDTIERDLRRAQEKLNPGQKHRPA